MSALETKISDVKTQLERNELLSVVMLAYRKHHMGDENVGWDELSTKMHNALCNVLGDNGYMLWVESLEDAQSPS